MKSCRSYKILESKILKFHIWCIAKFDLNPSVLNHHNVVQYNRNSEKEDKGFIHVVFWTWVFYSSVPIPHCVTTGHWLGNQDKLIVHFGWSI